MFWMVQVPDKALVMNGNTVTVHLENVPVTDVFTFYDPFPPSGNVPSLTSFTMTYRRSGAPRHVRATSADPTSPFNWDGQMWQATGAATFSVSYLDGSFSAQGTSESSGNFGEMGTERNGFFVH